MKRFAVSLALLLCAITAVAQTPAGKTFLSLRDAWVAVVSTDGRFRTRMPGKPELSVVDAGSKHLFHFSSYITGEDEDSVAYAVGYSDLDAGLTESKDIDNALDVSIRALSKRLNATIDSDKPVSVDSSWGRQVEMRIGLDVSPAARTCVLRACVENDRIYHVMVVGSKAALATSRTFEFLNEFQFIRPVIAVGDHAPAIAIGKFIRGTPITEFKKGTVYVVAFWNSDSLASRIRLPSVNRLFNTYKGVIFLGVSALEYHPDRVEPFIARMAATMPYPQAIDKIPPGKGGLDGIMQTTWLRTPTRILPDYTAVIVDKEGIIAWIGDPLEMDSALEKIANGTWDLRAAAARMAKTEMTIHDANVRVNSLAKSDYPVELAIVDPVIADDPDVEKFYYSYKLMLLKKVGKDKEAAAYFDRLILGILHNDPNGLTTEAGMVVDPLFSPAKPSLQLIECALTAATRADELAEGADANITDTLSLAYFAVGKKDLAISTDERALVHATTYFIKSQIEKHLATFRK
jgi:hypothetical protein